MDLEANQAPLAPPVSKTAPKVSAPPAAPLAEPVAQAAPAAATAPAAAPVEAVPAKEAESQVAEALQRTADDQAWQNRKRIELAEKLVGANKSLVIEKDPTRSAGFIYKTVDKTTGEVVRVWPQAEFQSKLSAMADVDARGIMLNARA